MKLIDKLLPENEQELKALLRANQRELRAVWDKQKEGWIVPSASSPGDFYFCKWGQCFCTGFLRWGMCQHVALSNYMYLLKKGAKRCSCGAMFYADRPSHISEFDRVHSGHYILGEDV